MINKICKILDSVRPQLGKIKFRKDEIKNLYPSIAKEKKILNWTPKIEIISGLKKIILYYKIRIKKSMSIDNMFNRKLNKLEIIFQ